MIILFLGFCMIGVNCERRRIPMGDINHSSNTNGEKTILQYFIQPRDTVSHHSRSESADDSQTVVGCYTLDNGQGHYRTVSYTAGKNGFQANIETNEPGTGNRNPANVSISSGKQKPIDNPCMVKKETKPLFKKPYSYINSILDDSALKQVPPVRGDQPTRRPGAPGTKKRISLRTNTYIESQRADPESVPVINVPIPSARRQAKDACRTHVSRRIVDSYVIEETDRAEVDENDES